MGGGLDTAAASNAGYIWLHFCAAAGSEDGAAIFSCSILVLFLHQSGMFLVADACKQRTSFIKGFSTAALKGRNQMQKPRDKSWCHKCVLWLFAFDSHKILGEE